MRSTHKPSVGEVWDVDFNPQGGREQGGIRPAIVISNTFFNRAPNGLHIVVPITATNRGIRYHIRVEPPEGGLVKSSVIMCDQARAQSELSLLQRRGRVATDLVMRVQAMVGEFIDR